MNRSFALSRFAGLALSLSAVACGGRVDSGPGTNQNGVLGAAGSSSTGSSSTGSSSSGSSGVNAIAISTGGSGSTDSSGAPMPSGMTLQVTNASYTCQSQTVPVCSQRTLWEVVIEFVPDAPGTYDLSDPPLYGYYSISGPSGDGANDCSGGGGSFDQGRLVIDQVDASTVHFHLVGTNQPGGPDSDGSYVAPRCD